MNCIFIVESNNDLDMLAPIIWKFSKDIFSKVIIVNTSPDHLSYKDPRILFIMKSHFVQYIEITKNFKIIDDISNYIYSKMKIGFFHRRILISLLGYSERKFEKIPFSKNLPTVLFVSYFKNHNAVKRAISWANKNKFIKVFNNHGITPFKVKKNLNINVKSPSFDICIFNKNSEKNLPNFNHKEIRKLYVAPRFSHEWSKKLSIIYKKKNNQSKKFRPVFMLSKWLEKDNKNHVLSAILAASRITNTEVIVKPHTRGMKIDENFPPNILIADEKYHSRKLIQESDVIIFTRSSIFLDAMLLDKPLIHLSYATNVELASDSLNSCKALNQKDLLNKLNKVKLKKRIYSPAERKECINFYAGEDQFKMLDKLISEIKLITLKKSEQYFC